MKAYMLTLSGQGDTYVKFIDQEAWDWMHLVDRDYKAPLPKGIEEKLRLRDGADYEEPNITSGSAFNDAALQCPVIAQFYDVKEAIDYVKANDVDVIDTFEGYIY